jgi:hypothetical protein
MDKPPITVIAESVVYSVLGLLLDQSSVIFAQGDCKNMTDDSKRRSQIYLLYF